MAGQAERYDSAFGGLAQGVLAIAVTAAILSGWAALSTLQHRRVSVENATETTCVNSDDCAQKSLKAYVRSADANEDAVDATVWQLGFNLIGLALVSLTVIYARKAWLASRAGVLASNTALEQAREATHLEQRAWIELKGIEIEDPGLRWTDGEGRISFKIRTRNVGRTPARGMMISLKLHIDITIQPHIIRDEMIAQLQMTPSSLGHLVFSRSYLSQSLSIPISNQDIVEAKENLKNSFGEDIPDTDVIFTYLIGVISYLPLPYTERRHTAFILSLKRSGKLGLAIQADVDAAPDTLALVRWPVGDMIAN